MESKDSNTNNKFLSKKRNNKTSTFLDTCKNKIIKNTEEIYIQEINEINKDLEEINTILKKLENKLNIINKSHKLNYKLNVNTIKLINNLDNNKENYLKPENDFIENSKKSSFKKMYKLSTNKEKQLYTEIKNELLNTNEEIFLNDLKNGFPLPVGYSYWPSLESYLFLKILDEPSNVKDNIDDIIKKKHFKNFTDITYKITLKNNKFKYFQYNYFRFNKEQTISTIYFKDWLIIDLKNKTPRDILDLRSGCYGNCKEVFDKFYIYYYNTTVNIDKDILKDVKKLNGNYQKTNNSFGKEYLFINHKNVYIYNDRELDEKLKITSGNIIS